MFAAILLVAAIACEPAAHEVRCDCIEVNRVCAPDGSGWWGYIVFWQYVRGEFILIDSRVLTPANWPYKRGDYYVSEWLEEPPKYFDTPGTFRVIAPTVFYTYTDYDREAAERQRMSDNAERPIVKLWSDKLRFIPQAQPEEKQSALKRKFKRERK